MSLENLPRKNLVLWAIFLGALGAALIAATTSVFPNLIMRTLGSTPDFFGINPFEIGIMAVPLVLTSFILLGIGILYFRGRLPLKILNSFKFISNFEISSRLAIIIIVLLIGGFIAFTVNQLSTEEPFPDYYNVTKPSLAKWTISSITKGFDIHVEYLLNTTSMKVFGNYKIIPYLASISLLVLTYFFTKLITKSRFAGIAAMAILLQSSIFLIYHSSVAYDNYWIFFYLLSLYAIYKFWPLSPISFIASIFTKPLTIVFLPFTLFFIYRAGISKRRKILTAGSYIFVIIMGTYGALAWKAATSLSAINTNGFWSAFNAFTYQLRFDPVVVIFLLPVTVMLFLTARRGAYHADSILLILMSTVLLQPLASAFTVASSEPYRFMPLIVFFAISVGMLLSKNYKLQNSLLNEDPKQE